MLIFNLDSFCHHLIGWVSAYMAFIPFAITQCATCPRVRLICGKLGSRRVPVWESVTQLAGLNHILHRHDTSWFGTTILTHTYRYGRHMSWHTHICSIRSSVVQPLEYEGFSFPEQWWDENHGLTDCLINFMMNGVVSLLCWQASKALLYCHPRSEDGLDGEGGNGGYLFLERKPSHWIANDTVEHMRDPGDSSLIGCCNLYN